MAEEESAQPVFHAGFPNAAVEAADIPLDLNRLVVRRPSSTFYLRVESDSWQELGLGSGDILVIDRSLESKANDLVVITDGEGFSIVVVPAGKAGRKPEAEIWGTVTWVIQQRRGGK